MRCPCDARSRRARRCSRPRPLLRSRARAPRRGSRAEARGSHSAAATTPSFRARSFGKRIETRLPVEVAPTKTRAPTTWWARAEEMLVPSYDASAVRTTLVALGRRRLILLAALALAAACARDVAAEVLDA